MNLKDRFTYVYMAWLINIVALFGSLFYSEVLEYPPCTLCWYQRICIYPLTIILAVGFLKKDENVAWYTLPLVSVGWIISSYHNLLYFKIIPEAIKTCTSGVSCTSKQIEYLGFVTIPLMAFTALTLTFILMVLFLKNKRTVSQ